MERFMTEQNSEGVSVSELGDQLARESEKNQLLLIPQLAASGATGQQILMDFLQSAPLAPINLVRGKIYQSLIQAATPTTETFLNTYFPTGVIPLESDRAVDYLGLQQLLARQQWQEADTLTRQKMCELAGDGALARKWVYFTEVEQFPSADLHTINSLWWLHSEGKFGFSVQRRLWLALGQDFNKLWPKIGWKTGNNWTKYPGEFIWSLDAPAGHLPLLNQLRGVRVAASLFNHPVWNQKSW
jgi:hypothetical protein